ncbi:hypothetical protein Godav_025604 [Gossypium davidsonii]|uniref:RNase H type-1 domain-containing protein n=2 Tax=Gossypium TaxID=3633 RepID=A0A7J8TEJ1_GOSDV|nr:hypothetical protein [Gossypium davidsonii]MBA0672274.1 hypothetical protein [Gossypium klotzschianum]
MGREIVTSISCYRTELENNEVREVTRRCEGIVARNTLGKVLVSQSILHAEVGMGFATEALTCSWVIQTGLEMGLTKAVIEGNSLTVIKKCNKNVQDRSEIGFYLEDAVSRFTMQMMEDESIREPD